MKNNIFQYFSKGSDGHRKDYMEFVEVEFGCNRAEGLRVLNKKPLLFLMIDECFFFFIITSLIRAAFLRKTSGLLFRVEPCAEKKSLKQKLKYHILRALKKIRFIRVISIVPFHINDKYEEFCHSWIYDFQLWDIKALYSSKDIDGDISDTLMNFSTKNNIVSAIGSQDVSKGYPQFCDFINEKTISYIVGGKIKEHLKPLNKNIKNSKGIVLDRFITNSELNYIYKKSKFIWCCYSPEYDQASGVFGRAVQYGCIPIVREHSVIHNFCINENINCIAYNPSKSVDIEYSVSNFNDEYANKTECRREYSRSTLLGSLGYIS